MFWRSIQFKQNPRSDHVIRVCISQGGPWLCIYFKNVFVRICFHNVFLTSGDFFFNESVYIFTY